jgi:hypothetical protein
MGLRNSKVVVPEETVAAEAPVQEEETTAVAVKEEVAAPAVAAGDGKGVPTLLSLLNKWSTDDVGNVFPRLVGTGGALYVEKLSLGEFADVQVFSHNERWMIVPVSDVLNDPKVKRYCRASYDGVTIMDRETGRSVAIDEYSDMIKADFPKGIKVGKYHDIFCTVFNCHKNLEMAKEKAILQVSISPTAVKDWQAFIRTTQFRELQGTVKPTHRNCVRLTADPRMTENSQNYTAIIFQTVPLEVIASYKPIIE